MFEKEESILNSLTTHFDFLREKGKVTRERRIFIDVPREKIKEFADFVKNKLGFTWLTTITGLEAGDSYQMIYHFADSQGIVLNAKIEAPKTDAVFDTVTEYYNGAMLYEIEIHNLLGVHINGIPEDISYPLPDGWPAGQYPLRKDWQGDASEPEKKGEC